MSSFLRTASGFSNLHLFYQVDLMVFVEGGGMNHSLREIEQGSGDASTDDAAFWANVFKLRATPLKVAIRSVGSKTSLTPIANLIAAGSIRRTVVGMDRDLDDRRGKLVSHPNILYTFGYSWENDVFRKPIAQLIVKDLVPNIQDQGAHQEMEDAARSLRKSFSVLVQLDHTLATQGVEPTDRDAIKACILIRTPQPPEIDRSGLAMILWNSKLSGPCVQAGSASVEQDLFGHLVARWWRSQIGSLLSRRHGLRVPNSLINRLAISAYFRVQSISAMTHYKPLVDGVLL